jgi:ABC-type transport system substrate-binding protein
MRRLTVGLRVLFLAFLLLLEPSAVAVAAPEGTMTWGVHITLASRWLDPAETEGIITPFMVLYALHDALVKPMPAGANTPSLAESWSQSKDGLTFEFVLRKGVKFHNGEPVTAEDVKLSFERYRGADSDLRAGVHLGRRSAGGGARHQPDQRLCLLGALRGPQTEATVSPPGRSR